MIKEALGPLLNELDSSAKLVPVEGINDPYWRKMSKGEVPEAGQVVWICAHGRIAKAIYEAEDQWLNPDSGNPYILPDNGGNVRAPYWLPVTNEELPSGPGHDVDFALLYHGQAVWAFTTDPTPIWASFDPHLGEWVNEEGGHVAGVRFWKTAHQMEQPPSQIVSDPQDTLEDL